MKNSSLLSILFASAALTLGSTGCVHKSPSTTQIPENSRRGGPTPTPMPVPDNNIQPGGNIPPQAEIKKDEGPSMPFDPNAGPWGPVIANHTEDVTTLKADTVYFDLDSASIKKSEETKLEAVANYLKGNMADALRVEGNCDERGTEKYNLSLGQKRALAVREYLSNLGIDGRQVVTVPYGAAKPAVQGHDEKAWSKNRRGDFVLLTPK